MRKFLLAVPALAVSGLAFADGTPGVVDDTAILAAITGNQTVVAAIGAGVLLIVMVIAAFKWSKRAL